MSLLFQVIQESMGMQVLQQFDHGYSVAHSSLQNLFIIQNKTKKEYCM